MWFGYLDETGNTGRRLDDLRSPIFQLVAVLVHDEQVQPLARALEKIVADALGKEPGDVELHARHLYGGGGPWKGIDVEVRKDVYRAVVGLLAAHDCYVSHASIDKPKLDEKYNYPHSPYLLALQFLCEKLDAWAATFEKTDPSRGRIMLVADETKEHETRAVTLVADMQRWGSDLVRGRTLPRIIDTLHYVDSAASAGVQMADAVAFVLQRGQWKKTPPDQADEFIAELAEVVWEYTPTYRWTWPVTWTTG